jgi:two-component system, NtrC family, nitrogen regulation response regulator GlnG
MISTLTESLHNNALFRPDYAPCAGDPEAAGQIFPLTSAKYLPRVLVVDEERLVRWSLCETLTNAGYQVVDAQNGPEAREAIADEDHPIDVMLVDLKLPDGEGLLLVREARRRCLTCPVVVMTAYGSEDTVDAALGAGADHVILKPFDLDDLLRLVRQLCPAAAH